MCLDYPVETKPVKKGYKIFDISKNKLLPMLFGNNKRIVVGKWLNEKDYREFPETEGLYYTLSKYGTYGTGFHVMHIKRKANSMAKNRMASVVREVLVEEPVAVGFQHLYGTTTVAKRIKILPMKRNKKCQERV